METSLYLLSNRYLDKGKLSPQPDNLTQIVQEVDSILRTRNSEVRYVHEYCPLCGGRKALVIAWKDRRGLPTITQICEDCGLVYSGESFTSEFAKEYYSKYAIADRPKIDRFSPQEMFQRRTKPGSYTWSRHKFIKKHLGNSYDQLQFVIEIGCGDGCNLYPYHLDGKHVVGCDFNEARLEAGRIHGLTIFQGGIEVLLEEGYKADLVILSHLIAHVSDVGILLQQTKKLLSPTGFLYIETPGIIGWNRKFSEATTVDGYVSSNNFLSYLDFELNYFFELKILQLFLLKHGFQLKIGDEIIRSIFVPKKGINGASELQSIKQKEHAQHILKYLQEVEQDWQRHHPFIKRFFRKVSQKVDHFIKRFLKS